MKQFFRQTMMMFALLSATMHLVFFVTGNQNALTDSLQWLFIAASLTHRSKDE